MSGANGNGNGYAVGGNHLSANLAYTKFLFIAPLDGDSDAMAARLRQAGAVVARGFVNDFDAEGTREQGLETVQFFVAGPPDVPDAPRDGLAAAPYALQVSGKNRPRLQDAEAELRRRVGETGQVWAIDGAAFSRRGGGSHGAAKYCTPPAMTVKRSRVVAPRL